MKKLLPVIYIILLLSYFISALAGEIYFEQTEPSVPTPQEIQENIEEEIPTPPQLDSSMPINIDFQENQNKNSYNTTHPTPASPSQYSCNHDLCFWNTPMDIRDTKTIWEVMDQPITVLEGNVKKQHLIRKEPSTSSDPVGEVTYSSQGVHVLDHLDNGWSLIETYSSSFHDSKVRVWGDFVQGYVETKFLKEIPPKGDYGMVIDKLTQRLYIIKEGELFTTLIISTGLPNERQPYNESRSGEYIVVSAVGAFYTDNLVCELALRYNAGDLIHKVPYILRGETKYYEVAEPYLGERASHGCIRVQRKRTPEGVNQDWLWSNRVMGSKVWIWEDYQGRQIDMPDNSLTLYYNPDGGKNYHKAGSCYGVRDKFLPLSLFTYGELSNSPYSSLTPCEYCNPPMRPETIMEKNLASALP